MPISGQFVIGSSKKVHRTSHNRPSDSSHLGASLTPVSSVSERQVYDRPGSRNETSWAVIDRPYRNLGAYRRHNANSCVAPSSQSGHPTDAPFPARGDDIGDHGSHYASLLGCAALYRAESSER